MPLLRRLSGLLKTAVALLAICCAALGCSSETPPSAIPVDLPTAGITLTPFASPSPPPARSATPGRPASPTPLPSPTPTPFLYAIVEGDTLIGIAFRFGIETEALLAANPGIDPRFLVIGEELVIPVESGGEEIGGQPTPVGAARADLEPVCYPGPDGGAWCFLLVENRGTEPLENLLASISLYGQGQDLIATRTAIGAVNLLPPGGRLPLMSWFPPPAGSFVLATARLEAALPVPAGDGRYLEADLVSEVELLGGRAVVRGEVGVPGEQPAGLIWIGLAAFDGSGQVVAVRRLELAGEFNAGASQTFEVELFSLAGEIREVEVLVEARP